MHDSEEITRLLRDLIGKAMGHSMHAMWRFARRAGLSMPQFGLLRRLCFGGGSEVHEVGKDLDMSSAGASQLVDRLVQAGLVARTERPDDRRARQVAPTAKGRAVVEKAYAESLRWVDQLVAELPADRRATVAAALASLLEAEGKLPRQEKIPERAAIRAPR
jgi:DNA-binding MarR family transcriptional regulator